MKQRDNKHSTFQMLPHINNHDSSYDNPLLFKRTNNHLLLSHAFLFNNTSLSIDNFQNQITKVMHEYKYEAPEEDRRSDITRLIKSNMRNTYKKDKEDIRKLFTHSKCISKSQSSPILLDKTWYNPNKSNDSIVRINIQKENFKNPIQAFNIVQKNKIIYENMMENFESREYDQYQQTFFKLKNFMNQIKLSPKIKIIPKIPKTVDSSWNKDNNNQRKKDSLLKTKSTSLIPIDKKVDSLQLIFRTICQRHFPESREQFVFCQEGNELIIHGGFVSNKSSMLWRLNPTNFKWTKLVPIGPNVEARYGHTGILYHRKLIIFGGRNMITSQHYDLNIFNIDTLKWSTPNAYTYTKHIKMRRNHIACLVGNQMLIQGGSDEDGNFLNDAYLLNLNPIKWVSCHISNEKAPTLAFHSCCLVLQEDLRLNTTTTIYKFADLGVKQPLINQIRERGIYVFGGKESENGQISQTLWILRIGKYPLEWVKLRTQGQSPSPRYLTSINYYEEGNCVIIHGGRNDYLSPNYAFDDTYVLDLYTLNWVKILYYNEPQNMSIKQRCSHSSVIHGHNLIIFGGMNSDLILGSSLSVLELDSNSKVQLKIDEANSEKGADKIAQMKANKKVKV